MKQGVHPPKYYQIAIQVGVKGAGGGGGGGSAQARSIAARKTWTSQRHSVPQRLSDLDSSVIKLMRQRLS